ncbi:probable E3 ubiquitin-protein ligase RNF217 [Puntigrus tetrazona]|uniref:probable E3 ubiquitin-protein ligase RNF217 n=1 Tax=Puntigrus tetrazona TaxID=1606681 RepID=UPI001C8903E2|nr:probable E3 ubiquitin-protein ligase RNF217 [Puntigrus tetrazona]
MAENIKKLTWSDKNIKVVQKASDLDVFDDDPGVLRVEMSCGHVADPMSLTDCCRAQLLNGDAVFKCPLCESEWPYDEVRKSAKLTNNERIGFEDLLGTNAAKKSGIKDCPRCGTFIERLYVSNLCVECCVCTKRAGKAYKFCWRCLRAWKGPGPRSDHCANVGCSIGDRETLQDCPMVTLRHIENVRCPALRSCPACGVAIEHSKVGCKIMTCRNCGKAFCFLCLKPAQECLETSRPYTLCTDEVAPKQRDAETL